MFEKGLVIRNISITFWARFAQLNVAKSSYGAQKNAQTTGYTFSKWLVSGADRIVVYQIIGEKKAMKSNAKL